MGIMYDKFAYIEAISSAKTPFPWILLWKLQERSVGGRAPGIVCPPEFCLPMSDSCNVTARVAVVFPANFWFSSRKRSPYVALDFKDFVRRLVSVYAPGAVCICWN